VYYSNLYAPPAVQGGQPQRDQFLPFHMPMVEEDEINAVTDTLKSGWLTKGPKTIEFEKKIANYIGAKHAIALNSCTSALHLSLFAKGIGIGNEVIIPSYTFAATANVVVHQGARPVLADINLDDFCMIPEAIEDLITDRTKAIIPVHFAGHPCDMDLIMKIAGKYNLVVIEDAAHALGAKYNGRMIGTIGTTTCFSFYVTKNITTGEGGMVTTDSDDLANELRTSSLHGMDSDAWNRYSDRGSWYYEVVNAGYKYNMNDLQASIGNTQANKIERFQKDRENIAKIYTEEFEKISDTIIVPQEKKGMRSAWHLFPILLIHEKLNIDRNKFIDALKAEKIGSSVHFIPIHMHPYYREKYGYKKDDFPNALYVFEHEISLPIYPKMTQDDAMDVALAMKKLVKYFKK
jgi:dTDP-4-amino-4,6-dideoxygalactose transaminase